MIEDFKIVDRLAHAYGWSIEYITNLEMNEVTNLLLAISERELVDRRMESFIAALAACGKTLDDIKSDCQNSVSTPTKNHAEQPKRSSDEEQKNMLKLFQGLGMTPNQVLDGINKGKLEI